MKLPAVASLLLATALRPASALVPAGGPETPLDVTAVNYTDSDGVILQGFLSLPPPSASASDGSASAKVPALVVLHDASGADEYEQQRASLAASQLGYVGFAADAFGLLTERPPEDASWSERMPFLSQFTNNRTLIVDRINAAVDYVRSLDEVDGTKVALAGYCMGGTGIVHYLSSMPFENTAPVAAAAAFHPSLSDFPPPAVGSVTVPSLFLTGGSDFLTSPASMAVLEADLTNGTEGTGARWETVRYAGIQHGFSNWFSDAYDPRTDARSWHSMVTFLEKEFGHSEAASSTDSAAGMESVDYVDAAHFNHPLKGYVAMPEGEGPFPAVVVLPSSIVDNGPDEQAQLAAKMAAEEWGVIGLAADVEDPTLTAPGSGTLPDVETVLSRTRAAIDLAKGMEGADPDRIALLGFGPGGSAALWYALWTDRDPAVKAAASVDGDLETFYTFVAKSGWTSVVPAAAEGGGSGSWGGNSGGWSGGGAEGGTWSGGGAEGGAWSGGGEGGGWSGGDGAADGGSTSWTADGDVPGAAPPMPPPEGTEPSTGNVTAELPSGENATADPNGRNRLLTGNGGPRMLIVSTAAGDDMSGVVIPMETALIAMGADYELTRFSAGDDARAYDQFHTMMMEEFEPAVSKDEPVGEPADEPADEPAEGAADTVAGTDSLTGSKAPSPTPPEVSPESDADPAGEESSAKATRALLALAMTAVWSLCLAIGGPPS